MASDDTSSIPISEQHAFLDLAKEFHWAEVKRQINANPLLVNVQPCGRDGTPRWSALHQAAFGGSCDSVRFLLEYKADIHAKTNDGQTPLDVAKSEQVRAILRGISAEPAGLRKVATPLRARAKASVAKKKVAATMKAKKRRNVKIAKGKYAKALVFNGKFVKTVGGLTRDHLVKNKAGKVVSKRLQSRGKQAYVNIKSWVESMMKARAELGLSGFVAVKKGSPLHAKTMDLYRS